MSVPCELFCRPLSYGERYLRRRGVVEAVGNLHADSGGAAAKITFDGVSSGLAITRAQYSVDAGEWFIVFPASGLSDGPKENYQIELPGLAPGPHTIAVQIADRYDNTTATQITFTAAQRPAK